MIPPKNRKLLAGMAAVALVIALGSAHGQQGPSDAEAAVDLGCPKIPMTSGPAALPNAGSGVYDMFIGANAATIVNRVDEIIAILRAQNIDQTLIVDTLLAAYCPVVAADTGLTYAQKRSRMDNFGRQVTHLVFGPADK